MRIRVATLNVWALPMGLTPNVTARMHAIGKRLASLELDVIAFQEVWTANARDPLVAAGHEAGLDHAWHDPASFSGGLLVLTRLPILAAHFKAFALRGDPVRPNHPDFYGGKGWATLELDTPAGRLAFVDTHLHARYPSDGAHRYRALRVGQITELALALRELPYPVVVAGDFNIPDAEPEYGMLTGLSGMRDAAAELDVRLPTVSHENPYRSQRRGKDHRIDYVLTRDGGTTAVVARSLRRVFDERLEIESGATGYSDHFGLLAELELEPGAARPIPAPSPHAVSLATQILNGGRREAEQRRRGERAWAGVGLGAAVIASLGMRDPRVSRRRLLRTVLQAGALLALTPGVGLSIVSELLTPDELRAFDQLALRLTQLRVAPPAAHSA